MDLNVVILDADTEPLAVECARAMRRTGGPVVAVVAVVRSLLSPPSAVLEREGVTRPVLVLVDLVVP